ncbi:MAG: flavin-dependent dehydrogenase [Oleiphilaceae bacterium]|jgi:flavin-dependent dehydrogenase
MSKAIVIGAGIAGLINAKILAKHFNEVIILEKDKVSDDCIPEHRKGLPQAHHQHILLMKGRELFESIFPGFDNELASMGAPELSYSNDIGLYVGHGKLPRFPSDLKVRPSRRIWIDALVRKRVESLPNVVIKSNIQVQHLDFNQKQNRVTGLIFSETHQGGSAADNAQTKFSADLVIDCSGRGSRIVKWLKELGFTDIESTVIDPKLGYASCLLKIPENYSGVRGIEVAPHAPDNPRAAGLWEVEKGTWLLTLIGMAGEYPPKDIEGFKAFADSLPTSAISDILNQTEQISEIKSFRGTQNIWRHYDKMPRYPNGLLVLGDALCAFNPLHGQGLTLIARSAQLLDQRLQQGKKTHYSGKWSQSNYRKLNRVFLSAWMFAISEDMRWPETIGRKVDWKLKLAYRFTDKLLMTSQHSKYVTRACLAVANMLRSPASLIMPGILLRMCWYSFYKQEKHKTAVGLNPAGSEK